MKLHTKLILTLLVFLSVVIIAAQFVQFLQISGQISNFSESNITLLTEREEGFARNLYRSVANSVGDSLNRGEMEKFSMLLSRTSEVEGLEEFSLFDTGEVVSHSSNSSFLKKSLPGEISQRVNSGEEMIYQMDDKAIEIYHAQKVVPDCLRCHLDWKLSDP
ncbi:MAG: hypothetical protein D6B25_03280, partial [Desulfobulbaceae bacterium]